MVYLLLFIGELFAQNAVEKRVNEHLIKTQKKIEIEGKKKEVELEKDFEPIRLMPPTKKKSQPFMTEPEKPYAPDPEVLDEEFDHSQGVDPAAQIEQDVKLQKEDSEEVRKQEYIRQFKKNAEEAGVKVEVDPKTLKARPVK